MSPIAQIILFVLIGLCIAVVCVNLCSSCIGDDDEDEDVQRLDEPLVSRSQSLVNKLREKRAEERQNPGYDNPPNLSENEQMRLAIEASMAQQ